MNNRQVAVNIKLILIFEYIFATFTQLHPLLQHYMIYLCV